jgi:hypothetical protein
MAVQTPFNITLKHMADGVHNFASHQFAVALCAAANAPVASNTVLANLTQISYTNLSSRNLTLTASETTGTNGWRGRFADLVLTATGGSVGPFRYVAIYNDTPTSPADPLVSWVDLGADQTIADGGSFTIDFTDANQIVVSLAWV